MSAAQFPAMRDEVIASLRSLSDTTHQREQWGRYDPEISYYDDLSLNVHTLYDDCEVLPDPAAAVPAVLREGDVSAFEALEAVLGPLLEQLGDRPDADYMSHPQWPEVVRAASAALAAMRASDTG